MSAAELWKRRPTAPASAMWLIAVMVLGIVVWNWLEPIGYSDSRLRDLAVQRYGREIREHYEAVRKRTTLRPLRVPITQLVDLEVTVILLAAEPAPAPAPTPAAAAPVADPLPRERYAMRALVRWEMVLGLILTLIVLAGVPFHLTQRTGRAHRFRTTNPDSPAPDSVPQSVPPALPPAGSFAGVEQIFADDVEQLLARADNLEKRSKAFLTAGVGVALIGLAILQFAPPPSTAAGDTPALLVEALRPAAVLLFAETIAFFLLRQYTNLMGRYAHLDALILKRQNWVAVCRLASIEKLETPAGAALLAALAGETFPVAQSGGGGAADNLEPGGAVLADFLSKMAVGSSAEKK